MESHEENLLPARARGAASNRNVKPPGLRQRLRKPNERGAPPRKPEAADVSKINVSRQQMDLLPLSRGSVKVQPGSVFEQEVRRGLQGSSSGRRRTLKPRELMKWGKRNEKEFWKTDSGAKSALTWYMAQGLSYSIESYTDLANDELGKALDRKLHTYDFFKKIRIPFPPEGGQKYNERIKKKRPRSFNVLFGEIEMHRTPEHAGKFFTFTEYAPEVFRRLRNLHGIDDDRYIEDVCDLGGFINFETNSKSGNFFFYSQKGEFMVKSLTRYERAVMMKILPAYYTHLLNYEDSLLTRFCGVYHINSPAGKVYFVIMKSVFSYGKKERAIHMIYDLKGSTKGRDGDVAVSENHPSGAENENQEAQNEDSSVGKPDTKGPPAVKKDNDLRRDRKNATFHGVRFTQNDRNKFLHTINQDVFFLTSCNIMDYSLLLAVSFNENHDKRPVAYDRASKRLMRKGDYKGSIKSSYFKRVKMERKSSKKLAKKGLRRLSDAVSQRQKKRFSPKQKPKGGSRPNALSPNPNKSRVEFMFRSEGKFAAYEVTGNQDFGDIYYMGIIDILQEYTWKKFFETCIKSLTTDKSGISAVPSYDYGKRFKEFLPTQVLADRSKR